MFQALNDGATPKIFGTAYSTPDGSCVRDYVHVADVAAAHVEAARKLQEGVDLEPVYNLGSGTGVSVRQIMTEMASVTGDSVRPTNLRCPARRSCRIVASGELARRDIAWEPRHTLRDMIHSAWAAAGNQKLSTR